MSFGFRIVLDMGYDFEGLGRDGGVESPFNFPTFHFPSLAFYLVNRPCGSQVY